MSEISLGTRGMPGASNIQFISGNDSVPVGPNPATFTINLIGDATAGVSLTGNPGTYTETITVANATTTTKGVAYFDPVDFVVVGGKVSLVTPPTTAWTPISANQTLAINNGYICVSPGGALSLALPAVSPVGSIIEVTLDGATSFTVTQSAGQQIVVGNTSTTAGVGGSLSSTQQGDSLRMVCSVANLRWNVLSTMGNPIIV